MTTPTPTGQLRLYDGAGAFVCLLPEWEQAACQEELNGPGGWSVTYPVGGLNAATLKAQQDGQVAFLLDGTEVFRGLLEDDGGDDADPAAPLTVSGRGLLAVLERAVTYPPGGAGTLPAERQFAAATPGTILGVLLSAAQARGVDGFAGLSWTFTPSVDSAGVAWPLALTVTYDAGIDYLKVAEGLVGQGVVELRAVGVAGGIELQAYAPGTVLNRDLPNVLLHLARDAKGLPRQRSRRGLASHVLVIGDEGANAERSDATSAATWGRREVSLSQGNTTNAGTMAVLGDALLGQRKQPQHGRTLAYDLAARDSTHTNPTPRPWVDFRPGDRIRVAGVRTAAGDLEPLRVRTCAAKLTPDGVTAPSVELGDLFLEATLRLKRRIEGIVNGSVVSAGGAGPPPDTRKPAAPASCAVTSAAYQVRGVTLAQATISWPAVTTNTDGTALNDLAGYLVGYEVNGGGWTADMTTSAAVAYVDGLRPGVPLRARVRAVDRDGYSSPYTVSGTITTGSDTTPPPTPSTPTLSAAVGGFRARWDGLGSAGEAMPADLGHVEVHVSTGGATFAPSAATLRDQLLAAGTSPLTGDAYDTTVWVRLVAVDLAGNRSAPSTAASITPARATGGDIAKGQIGYDQIAFKDVGNLWPDGSFEDPAIWNGVTTPSGDSMNGATINNPASAGLHGVRSLNLASATGQHVVVAAKNIPVAGGEKFLVRFLVRPSATAPDTPLSVGVRWSRKDGTGGSSTLTLQPGQYAAGVVAQASGVVSIPADATDVALRALNGATGTVGAWQVDAIEIREVVQTAVIDDAAIVRAKIANLAVDTAKIDSVEVGKLGAGRLIADFIELGGRLTTAAGGVQTGARVEYDAMGVRAYGPESTSASTGKVGEFGADGVVRVNRLEGFIPRGPIQGPPTSHVAGAHNLTSIRYWKTASGQVQFEGLIEVTGTTTSDIIFILPTGYRPSSSAVIKALVLTGSDLRRVNVNSNGHVSWEPGTRPPVSVSALWNISMLAFYAA